MPIQIWGGPWAGRLTWMACTQSVGRRQSDREPTRVQAPAAKAHSPVSVPTRSRSPSTAREKTVRKGVSAGGGTGLAFPFSTRTSPWSWVPAQMVPWPAPSRVSARAFTWGSGKPSGGP